jgi:hypothetical protein
VRTPTLALVLIPGVLASFGACRGPEFVSDGGSPATGGTAGQGATPSSGGGPTGGSGATGGGPVNVEVDVIFENYRTGLVDRPVIVHDPAGMPLSETATDITGEASVTVPAGGFVTVIDQDEGSFVYTAKIVEGTTLVRFFSQSDDGNVNEAGDQNILSSCAPTTCAPGGRAELHRSCEPTLEFNLPVGAPFSNFTVSSTQYPFTKGCPETPTFETTLIFYADNGTILRYGSATASLPDGPPLFGMVPVSSGDLSNVSIALGGLSGDWTHSDTRFIARDIEDLPIRTWDTDKSSISLVTDLATNLLLVRGFEENTTGRAVVRMEEYDLEDPMPPFGFDDIGRFGSLGIPNVDAQPRVPWQLEGPVGDLLLFELGESTSGITWYVMLPADATGEAVLPSLPAGLDNLTLVNPDYGAYAHFEVAGDYPDALKAGLGLFKASRSLPLPMTVSSIFGDL